MKVAFVVVVVLVFAALGVVIAMGSPARPAESAPPSPWEALPQTPDGRVGVWTMCSHGTRLILAVPGPQSGPAITTAGDPACVGEP